MAIPTHTFYLTHFHSHSPTVVTLLERGGFSADDMHTPRGPNNIVVRRFEERFSFLDALKELTQKGIPYVVEIPHKEGVCNRSTEYHFFNEKGECAFRADTTEWQSVTAADCIKAAEDAIANGKCPVQALKELKESFTYASWDNQGVFSKRYLALKLLEPTMEPE